MSDNNSVFPGSAVIIPNGSIGVNSNVSAVTASAGATDLSANYHPAAVPGSEFPIWKTLLESAFVGDALSIISITQALNGQSDGSTASSAVSFNIMHVYYIVQFMCQTSLDPTLL